MKTEFELDSPKADLLPATVTIYSDEANGYPPRLHIQMPKEIGYVELMPKHMEKFAVNILKALKSKKLKP